MKFEFNWPSGLRRRRCLKMLTDGRQTDAGVTGILIAHLGAFGSGELIKIGHKLMAPFCYHGNDKCSKISNTFLFLPKLKNCIFVLYLPSILVLDRYVGREINILNFAFCREWTINL